MQNILLKGAVFNVADGEVHECHRDLVVRHFFTDDNTCLIAFVARRDASVDGGSTRQLSYTGRPRTMHERIGNHLLTLME